MDKKSVTEFKKELYQSTLDEQKNLAGNEIVKLQHQSKLLSDITQRAIQDGQNPGKFAVDLSGKNEFDPQYHVRNLNFHNAAMNWLLLKLHEMQIREESKSPQLMVNVYRGLDQARFELFQHDALRGNLLLKKLRHATNAFLNVSTKIFVYWVIKS